MECPPHPTLTIPSVLGNQIDDIINMKILHWNLLYYKSNQITKLGSLQLLIVGLTGYVS